MKDGCVWIVTVQNIKLYAFQNKCVGLLEIQKCIPKSLVALKKGHQSNFLQLQNICNKSAAPYCLREGLLHASSHFKKCLCVYATSPHHGLQSTSLSPLGGPFGFGFSVTLASTEQSFEKHGSNWLEKDFSTSLVSAWLDLVARLDSAAWSLQSGLLFDQVMVQLLFLAAFS